MYMHTYTQTYIYTYTYMYTCTYTRIHVHTYTYVCICTRIHRSKISATTPQRVKQYHRRTYASICICMHIYTYIHIHQYAQPAASVFADVYVGVKTHLCNIHTCPCTSAQNTCKAALQRTCKEPLQTKKALHVSFVRRNQTTFCTSNARTSLFPLPEAPIPLHPPSPLPNIPQNSSRTAGMRSFTVLH